MGEINLILIKENNESLFEAYLSQVAECTTEYPFFILGMADNNPLKAVTKKLSHISYRSKVYRIDWEKETEGLYRLLKNFPIYLECGLL